MYKYLIIFILILVGCGSTQVVETPSDAVIPPPAPQPPVAEGPEGLKMEKPSSKSGDLVVQFTNAERIKEVMQALTTDELKGREAGTEGIEKAAIYLIDELKKSGVSPYYNSYNDTISNFSPTAYNVVAFVEGNDANLKKEYIVIGAHYDHIGVIEAVNGDAIANGANDNASGSTTILELARYFASSKTNKRSLIFAWFTAEEKGLLGSKSLAAQMKVEKLNLYAMLNYEMVGVPLVGKDYFMYITGYEKSNLADIGNNYAGEKLIGYLPTAKKYGLFQRSDNYPFANEFAVPSHTFCTFDFTNFDFYHKPGDEIELMNFEHMARVVNKSIPMIEGIANSTAQELKMK